jgi:hypothetical protein
LLKAGASAVLLTLGLIGGVLPSQLADVIKAVGGFSVAKDIVESIGAAGEVPPIVRSDDLYFLLRLDEAAASQ